MGIIPTKERPGKIVSVWINNVNRMGRTFTKQGLFKGKVQVHLMDNNRNITDERFLIHPDKITIIGFID